MGSYFVKKQKRILSLCFKKKKMFYLKRRLPLKKCNLKTRRKKIPGFKSKTKLGDQIESSAHCTVFVASKCKAGFVKPHNTQTYEHTFTRLKFTTLFFTVSTL
jgi:hypothetical protein